MKFVNTGPNSCVCIGEREDVLHSYGSNQGFVAGRDTCLVIDSGFHYHTAQQVLRKVRRLGSRRLLILDTHCHSDHVFGNGVFAQRGVSIVSHDKCRLRMRSQSSRLLSRYRRLDPRVSKLLGGIEVALPSITYNESLRVHLTGCFPHRDSVKAKLQVVCLGGRTVFLSANR